MSNYSTTDGLKKFSLLPEAPLRPEARDICHICHMVNPALNTIQTKLLRFEAGNGPCFSLIRRNRYPLPQCMFALKVNLSTKIHQINVPSFD